MKIYFMTTSIKQNHFLKVLIVAAVLLMAGIYSCNDTSTKEEKKDSVAAQKDTTMKMSDTTKTDTTGKGGQPSPGGH